MNLSFIIILILVLCCSMLSSTFLIVFGEKIPIIGPEIGKREPYFISVNGFSIFSSFCLCILLIIFAFWSKINS